MKTINRTAIAIIPKQPYIDWANSFEDLKKVWADRESLGQFLSLKFKPN